MNFREFQTTNLNQKKKNTYENFQAFNTGEVIQTKDNQYRGGNFDKGLTNTGEVTQTKDKLFMVPYK